MKKLFLILFVNISMSYCAAQITASKDVLVIIGLGQSNMGTNPSNGPLNIDSLPAQLKNPISNVLIDTVINSALYLTPFMPGGTGAGYMNQVLWREAQVYKWVIYIRRSLGGTQLHTPTTYPIADAKLWVSTLKPVIHNIADTSKCDVVYIYDQGETDAATLAAAVNFKTNWINFVALDMWPNYWNAPVIAKKPSNMQTDFPYIPQLVTGMDSIKAAYPNRVFHVNTDSLPMKGEGIKTGLTYNGDFSHHREETAIKVGNIVSDTIDYLFGKVKPDRVKPLLVRATINAAGTAMTLKFTETLQDKAKPHPSNFVCGTKNFINIVISGDSVVLTPSSLFYSGTSYTIGITKDGYFKINLQDRYGNELSTVSNFPVINNCSVSSPTFSTIYTSNFTTLGSNPADLPNFFTVASGAGGTGTANQTSVTGVTVCAKIDINSGGGTRFTKWQTSGMNTSGKIYIVGFDIEVPRSMSQTGNPNSFYMIADNLDHSGVFDFSKLLKRGQMTHIEYQFTEGTPVNDDWYLEFGCNNNSTVYVKNLVIRSN